MPLPDTDGYTLVANRANNMNDAWIAEMDPTTALLAEHPDKVDHVWSINNAAADLYSSLVYAGAYLNRSSLAATDAEIRVALAYETANVSRVDAMPDDWDVDDNDWSNAEVDMDRVIYGAAEYLRDGLLRVTEVVGLTDNPWWTRLLSILDDMMAWADLNNGGLPVSHPAPEVENYNGLLGRYHEVNGELLQVLARVYAATGTAKYLTWLEQIADDVLLTGDGAYIPTREPYLKLVDHGGEIVSGLAEALMCEAANGRTAKVLAYQPGIKEMLDRVLEVGRFTSGIYEGNYYEEINPAAGTVIDGDPCDTWGYIYNGHYIYDQAMALYDGREPIYLATIQAALNTIAGNEITPFAGMENNSDWYADNLESMLYLANRITVAGLDTWLAQTIGTDTDGTYDMLGLQSLTTWFVDHDYSDGSFERICCLYAHYLAKGVRPEPWSSTVGVYGALDSGTLTLTLAMGAEAWDGVLIFDYARHSLEMGLAVNYPRINEWSEWYTVTAATNYTVTVDGGEAQVKTGAELISGLAVSLSAWERLEIVVSPQV